MKKFLPLLLLFVLVFAITACADEPAPPPADAATPAEGDFTLGFILGSREHAFYLLVEEGILAAADQLGFEAIVLESDLRGDVASERIQDLMVLNVDAISLAINEPAATNVAIENASAEGFPMFGFDARTDLTDKIISFVGTDNFQGGVLAGQVTMQTLRDLGVANGAVIGVIQHLEPQSTVDREAGWRSYVEQYVDEYNLTIHTIGNYMGQADIARNLMEDALILHPDMVMIFSVGSPASVGALSAIHTAGATTRIVGFDANPEAHAAILDPVDGQIWIADIAQDPFAIGFGVAEQKILWLTQGRVDAAEILISPFVVDSSNAVMP
ncbi:MAG: substrate-binding domain-containing protein [Oscillospiraceae bacterium]|nr:substrate-binding domain-containing protein [Oscillospiraceae bacterium]MCL2278509.1 substrate-binding domain-containing protein [Oscillospiraceae bacterium]